MSAITTHVLDVARGRPASGVPITLEIRAGDTWRSLGSGSTDADGRLRTLLAADQALEMGEYRISFDTGAYFAALGVEGFYPSVQVQFTVRNPGQHHHVPVLLSPIGFSTYLGS